MLTIIKMTIFIVDTAAIVVLIISLVKKPGELPFHCLHISCFPPLSVNDHDVSGSSSH